jgi:SAM-dependent methyltransferase
MPDQGGVKDPVDVPRIGADEYARGMARYDGGEAESTPELDRFQFGLFSQYLGNRILEIGAGGGRFTAQVLQANCNAEVVVAEPSAHFLAQLKQRFQGNSKLTLLQSEVGGLSVRYAGYFDSVFAVDVLEHIADDRAFLQGSLQCVRPGGHLIILVPAFQFLYSKLDENIGHYRRYDRSMMLRLLSGMNVQIEKMFYSNLLGFLGSLYFSKLRKINYQAGDSSKREFFRIYRFFSRYVVPVVAAMERHTWVPFGLHLTVILRKPTGDGRPG